MGVIRTLLALAVVVFHSYTILGEKMTGGTVAVQLFYMISGFYMAMILNEKYPAGKGSYRLFITNRFLRIYPAYWVCLILAVLISVIGNQFWEKPFYLWYWTSQWDSMNVLSIVILVLINILLLGSDWLLFMGLNKETGNLLITHDAYDFKPMVFQFLFVPQIWSVGVELSFYLLAPLILRRNWKLQALIVAASLFLRWWLYHEKQWWWDPWSYRFFPNEIALFLGGSLAYQIFIRIKHYRIPQWVTHIPWLFMIVVITFYQHINFFKIDPGKWYLYSLFMLLLPLIFYGTRHYKWDRLIGELSFPIYIGHHFIMFLWRQYFFKYTEHMEWFGIACVMSSVVFALILMKWVVEPIEKIRSRRVLQNT